MSIESRLQALEKQAAQSLPVYLVTFENGCSANLDALGIILHLADQQAGKENTEAIIDTKIITGTLPAGSAWDDLREELQKIRQKGGKHGGKT